MPKFIDCFTYFDEDLLLDIRLNTLNDVIDKFVICESTMTHQGSIKKLNFNIENFKKFKHKIIYLVKENLNIDEYRFKDEKVWDGSDIWFREASQRNYLMKEINKFDDNDCIIISDLDEIPNPKLIKKNYSLKKNFYVFEQTMYYYKLNYYVSSNWHGSRMCLKKYLKSPNWFHKNMQPKKKFWYNFKRSIKKIKNGGWHFSYLKSPEDIMKKLSSFSHYEFNTPEINNLAFIENSIKEGKDIFREIRPSLEQKIQICEINKSYPSYIIDNINKFKNWIV